MNSNNNIASSKTLFGHPVGLFILFFTEMWERFSYYGMRALLVLYLVEEITSPNPGLGWNKEDAGSLYGTYTMLVYITPILGGIIADKILGFRKAITVGAILMSLGHFSLAFEPLPAFYLGLGLIIIGNGFFKPNISSIVGQLYPEGSTKKDSGYTIFYQGINVGAFLGSILCGYLAETIGWHWGFGLAGIFMVIGMIQFQLAQKMFGKIGLSPKKQKEFVADSADIVDEIAEVEEEKQIDELSELDKAKKSKVETQRLIVVGILAFFSIFFWAAFEQAGSSMNIYASEYTDRALEGNGAMVFKVVSSLISLLPVGILLWLFLGTFKVLGKEYLGAMSFMGLSVLILAGITGYMIYDQFQEKSAEVPATWFQSLNALFIFTLAPLFSFVWQRLAKSKYNPNGPQKFAIGLVLLGLGFIPLVYGSAGIIASSDEPIQKVSMIFLVLAYLLHTMGELSLSPVGLSYVSKLSPTRLVGVMFGIWFFASAMGNKLAGSFSPYMEKIAKESSMSDFFEILVYVPIGAGLLLFILSFPIRKLMHGIK
ncbi:peptide MFS transporter [Paracrocinitomix mangrovi]|uniref:peptide MFS transporter n=1 Tax=Paracrocinitomix mangrovi TaxID=2862509 RepID=UPI001C8EEE3D|nr:peptide MFS transporter [Paracrocinitomix mangrovi]UKN01741.1 peptide MFS transporter [Paracrocinitomix mangrovi]